MTAVNPLVDIDVDIDAWTRRVIDTHFDPEIGTSYWLEGADDRGIDPRTVVDGFDDLAHVFDPFDEEVLRSISVEEFAPRSLDGDRRVYETGGTTGVPKRVLMSEYWKTQTRWMARLLRKWGFPTGNVLGICPPGGANNAGTFVQHLAHEWDALPFHVTLDPRWVKALSSRGARREYDRYVDHLLEQVERVLRTQSVQVVFTTGRLLERPGLRDLIARSNVEGIIHGGTPLDADTNRVFREKWYDDVALVGEYGNTLMGIAPEAPPACRPIVQRGEGFAPQYVPCYPYFVSEVVDESGRRVEYGERGRVRTTVLSKEVFIPLLVECDAAIRIEGSEPFPWDWLESPTRYENGTERVVEGVY